MPDVLCLVHSLFQRAQGHGRYQAFFRLAHHLLQGFLHFGRFGFFADLQLDVEVGQKLGQVFHFIFVRQVVDTVNERPFLVEHMACHSLVSCQHKFFDDRFGYTADALHDLYRPTLVV